MSTILDALRKVEEANRMKNTDVRTRLLTGVSRFDLRRPRHQRLSWFIVVGLILIGIIVGTGVGGWKRQQPSGVEPPATSQMTEQQHSQGMAKAPVPLDSKPAATSQIAPADRPPPRIAETPFYPDPASTIAARPVPPPPPSTPPTMTGTPVPPAPAPVAKVAPADRPPPRIAETPFYPDPASGVPARPIPPVPTVQGEGASAPVVSARRRESADNDREASPNSPRARLFEKREDVRDSFEKREAVRDSLSTNPVQRSPFVNTPESERITPPPSSPPVERRVTAKAKPSPAPRVPAPPETTTDSAVEPTPAPLEEDVVTEATSPPTPASVSFLQWSPEPEKRIAFIKIGNAPTTLAHEGDTVNGVTVVKILQGAVELQSGDSRWTLKAR